MKLVSGACKEEDFGTWEQCPEGEGPWAKFPAVGITEATLSSIEAVDSTLPVLATLSILATLPVLASLPFLSKVTVLVAPPFSATLLLDIVVNCVDLLTVFTYNSILSF